MMLRNIAKLKLLFEVAVVVCELLDFVLGFDFSFSGNTTVIFGFGIVFTELTLGSFNF